ncbi:class I SAM-dependent methyltransferase [Dethiosulfatarculus sandiegensis]|nr:class I SAM-dependent methyltransferase [Dethiosulfatarculus sandiegensis]
MSDKRLTDLLNIDFSFKDLWQGQYKIPWDEPEFSRRMLREHLSQDHDLASRRESFIQSQTKWINRNILPEPGRILDLGCGPGLYCPALVQGGHTYRGIDFSPASIAYAKKQNPGKGLADFRQGDLRDLDFGENYDLVMMLYGELNVFSPEHCRKILEKARHALAKGGVLLLEVHRFSAVKAMAQAQPTWFKAKSGLFSSDPYLCLMENHWHKDQSAAEQHFLVIDLANSRLSPLKSTTKAWTNKELQGLLIEAGFNQPVERKTWPTNTEILYLISATKA